MTQVVSLTVTPPPRYDLLPWTHARIQEAATANGSYTLIDTLDLEPVDADPTAPLVRALTTTLGTGPSLFYRVVFADADAGLSPATPVVQNTTETTAYATADELAAHLKIRNPTMEQTAILERVLLAAAGEINSEIGRVSLAGWELALAAEVNVERAVEHWNQVASPFGLVGLGDAGPVYTARDSFDRHAHKLIPLKHDAWGIA